MNYGKRHIKFYESKAWKDVRKTIWLKQNLLCNRCHKPVYVYGLSDPTNNKRKGIVHHKEYITDFNINDVNVTLNPDNLEGICIDCHNKEHTSYGSIRNNYMFDEDGNIIPK